MFNMNFANSIPPIIKNLLIINGLMFLLSVTLQSRGISMTHLFGLFYFGSDAFRIWQPVTHLFMHANLTHLLFNMFSLWMFGKILENVWGAKRFLTYYLITGLGAAALHTLVNHISISGLEHAIEAFRNTPSPESFRTLIASNVRNLNPSIHDFINSWQESPDSALFLSEANSMLDTYLNQVMNIPTVGASGAVFGILLAFGMLFPDARLMLLFPPIPIKAKWFVLGYGAVELYLGIMQPGSQVAHFAHLGGMIFGYFLIRYWRSQRYRRDFF